MDRKLHPSAKRAGGRHDQSVASDDRKSREVPGRKAALEVGVGCAVVIALATATWWFPIPHDPLRPDPTRTLMPPSLAHPFGTDLSGFDLLARTLRAAQNDIPLAIVGTLLSALIGVTFGLLAGRRARGAEQLMRALDAFEAFPLIVLAVAVVVITGDRVESVVLAIVVVAAPRFMRLVRAESLVLREKRFVEAAVAMGASQARVLFRHILPNASGVIVAQVSLTAAQAVLVISALSFLGVGVAPPEPSWGAMIQVGARTIVTGHWWVSLFPGAVLFIVVLSFNVAADGLEVILER